jgi:hypothetical protein
MSEAPKNSSKPRRARAGKLSAFALASEGTSVNAQIDVGDVLCVRPNWSPKQAEAFLKNNADSIGAAMVLRGVEMILAIVGKDEYAN